MTKERNPRPAVLPALVPALLLTAALLAPWGAARATQVRIFTTRGQGGFLGGTLEGVGVDSLGRLGLGARVAKVAAIEEPFLFSAAVLPDGWAIGTGNSGKVLKVDRNGAVTELFAAPEAEVFALWADPDGTVFAGTSPKGKVYRIPPRAAGAKAGAAKADVFFDPGQTYIWSLARATDGSLLVGTGTEGKLFKVDGAGKSTLLYDSDDAHIRTLKALPKGDALVGTAGDGLVLKIGADGKARTLFDAEETEVVALALGADGTIYAAVASSEASLVDQARDQAAAGAPPGGKPAPGVTVTVDAPDGPPAGAGARKGGPKSQIFTISPAGVAETLWSFPNETVFDLLFLGDKLWVATGLEGKVYTFSAAPGSGASSSGGKVQLEKDVDDKQVVALLPGTPGPAFATTNAAALYRVMAENEPKGTYTSAPFDAGQLARFGTFSWRGEIPSSGSLRFSFRSGFSSDPDKTWSSWSDWREARSGEEIPLADLPPGKFVQWRAELRAGAGRSPRLFAGEVSYRQENLAPKISSFVALDPGQILVPANFNPTNQIYEPAHPNRDGIFDTLKPADDDGSGGRTKPLWKLGFQTLRWSGSDPNGDSLLYDLSFRPVADDGSDKGSWLPLQGELKDDYLSFDSDSLPDGAYRFRLRASDKPSNDPARALVAERISDPVVVDHSPPVLGKVERVAESGAAKGKGSILHVSVRDAANPLREALYSVDAKEWVNAEAADGLLDGRSETLLLPVPAEATLILLRVTDAAHNTITFDLSSSR